MQNKPLKLGCKGNAAVSAQRAAKKLDTSRQAGTVSQLLGRDQEAAKREINMQAS